jgi:DNA-directed RNA polymerase specialized sigma24 family protein
MSLPDLEGLVARVLAGEGEAWQKLWQEVEPKLYATLRRPHLLGRLSASEDDCRNIVVEVMGRLRANGHARLAQYAAVRQRNPSLPFMGWLVVVAKRTAIDYMRAHDTYIDRRHEKDASSPGGWRELDTLPADSALPGPRPPITGAGTAREVLEFAAADLTPPQQQALDHWLRGAGFEEIAAALALPDPKDADRLVRAGIDRIRRRFRGEGES